MNPRDTGDGSETVVDAIVVGAGLSGIYALYSLRRQGLRVIVLEADNGIGGTWYQNRYPGARCDIESLDYSYSFSPELQQDWNWTERYASQAEILAYLKHVVDRFDLRKDIELNARVVSAAFDETLERWTVRTENGQQYCTKYCLLATGVLSAAQSPQIQGAEGFAGRSYHTAEWPRQGIDFTGERVGVIGTGSSGTQLIPLVAEQAKALYVFQRTANFVMPAQNYPLDESVQRSWKENYPELRKKARASPNGHNQIRNPVRGRDVSQEERRAEFERRWQLGGLYMLRAFSDVLTDPEVNAAAAAFVREKIREVVTDPATAEALMPNPDLYFGTKRPCSGTNYYETFNRDNVTLVDLQRSPIELVTPTGIRTQGGQHYELDTIIYATGFDAMTGSFVRINVRGRHGDTLREKWHHGPKTYLGVATHGFPNLFIMAGPQTPSVFSNMVTQAEIHVEWVTRCIAYLEANGIATIEAVKELEDDWVAHVNDVANGTLYTRSRQSWFWGANTPGKARVFAPYLGGIDRYEAKLDAEADGGYKGFRLKT